MVSSGDWELKNTDFSWKIKTPDWCISQYNSLLIRTFFYIKFFCFCFFTWAWIIRFCRESVIQLPDLHVLIDVHSLTMFYYFLSWIERAVPRNTERSLRSDYHRFWIIVPETRLDRFKVRNCFDFSLVLLLIYAISFLYNFYEFFTIFVTSQSRDYLKLKISDLLELSMSSLWVLTRIWLVLTLWRRKNFKDVKICTSILNLIVVFFLRF